MSIQKEFQEDEIDDGYFFNQEKIWKKSLYKLTSKELLIIFPEIKKTIHQKVIETKNQVKEEREYIIKKIQRINALKVDEFSKWFGKKLIKMSDLPELTILEKRLFNLNHLLFLINFPDTTDHHYKFKEEITIAKKYSIENLARSRLELRQAGGKFISLCPFHEETTPSFYLYPDSNTFHCFGCQKNGDVLTLAMDLFNINFKEAVAMLQN